jgi:hypothetical protein
MSSIDAYPRDARSGDPQTAVRNGPHMSFWIRELPFSLVLILTLLGVAIPVFRNNLSWAIGSFWRR